MGKIENKITQTYSKLIYGYRCIVTPKNFWVSTCLTWLELWDNDDLSTDQTACLVLCLYALKSLKIDLAVNSLLKNH